jgi:uncharacterized membrane protein
VNQYAKRRTSWYVINKYLKNKKEEFIQILLFLGIIVKNGWLKRGIFGNI